MARSKTPSNFARSRTINKTLNVTLAVLLGGTTSLALAQSSKESFAERFANMQSLSSNSSNWQRDKPALSKVPSETSAGFSLRELQALSSDSPVWQIDQGKIEVDHGPTFAQTHPHGLSFSQYQAYGANSGEFALPPNADVSSFASTGTANVAGDTEKPSLRERFASFLHRGSAANTGGVK